MDKKKLLENLIIGDCWFTDPITGENWTGTNIVYDETKDIHVAIFANDRNSEKFIIHKQVGKETTEIELTDIEMLSLVETIIDCYEYTKNEVTDNV